MNSASTPPPPMTRTDMPPPRDDWICQRQLADLFAVSERTASLWAKAGRLRRFQHGFPDCGRRKFSRSLVLREIRERWERAVLEQDAVFNNETV
jgi:hypothetical protein